MGCENWWKVDRYFVDNCSWGVFMVLFCPLFVRWWTYNGSLLRFMGKRDKKMPSRLEIRYKKFSIEISHLDHWKSAMECLLVSCNLPVSSDEINRNVWKYTVDIKISKCGQVFWNILSYTFPCWPSLWKKGFKSPDSRQTHGQMDRQMWPNLLSLCFAKLHGRSKWDELVAITLKSSDSKSEIWIIGSWFCYWFKSVGTNQLYMLSQGISTESTRHMGVV